MREVEREIGEEERERKIRGTETERPGGTGKRYMKRKGAIK